MKSLFQINTTTPLLVVMLVLATAFTAHAQSSRIQMSSLDHLAPKASETVDVTIDERLMKMAAKLFSDKDADEKEVKELVAGLKGIYVKSFEFDTEGQYSAADVESIRTQLRAPGWTRLLNVTSKREGSVEVYMLMDGEQIGGLAVLSAEDKELTVVNIIGPVDLEKLAKLEGQLGVPDLGIETTKPKTKNDKN
ncbi:MAG TPA: DUF4252 domain-containing protein [Pyrinomonadaceae bacterium]|nr:DUF4252 domain-containing protein [Pyrinomonadaceae bacterium]